MKEVLIRLNSALTKQDHADWMQKIKEMKEKYPLALNKDVLTGPAVIDSLYNITNGDAIITTDVGQHQMWSAQHYKFKEPRTLLTSGGLELWDMVLVHV